jgi:Ras homolog gene family, member A
MYNRPYRFEFYDTASPTNYTLLRPAVIILCYSIADPDSLTSLTVRWKDIVEKHFNYDENLPVIVLGLQRDVRSKEDYGGKMDWEGKKQFVYPQEGVRVAQEMRCDRYCECSALTGEVRNACTYGLRRL